MAPFATGGFSLLEVVAVVVVVTILFLLAAPKFGTLLAKAQQVQCMSNMRSIHVGLNTYLNDHEDIWPQGPPPTAGGDWAEFWVRTLEPQGISARTWRCPTLAGMLAWKQGPPYDESSIHYVPTMFMPIPGLARRWPTQPWLVERADAHGNGALICFTDGAIKSFNQVLAEQGVR